MTKILKWSDLPNLKSTTGKTSPTYILAKPQKSRDAQKKEQTRLLLTRKTPNISSGRKIFNKKPGERCQKKRQFCGRQKKKLNHAFACAKKMVDDKKKPNQAHWNQSGMSNIVFAKDRLVYFFCSREKKRRTHKEMIRLVESSESESTEKAIKRRAIQMPRPPPMQTTKG